MYKSLSTQGLSIAGRQSEIIELALSFGFKGIDFDLAEFQTQVKAGGLAHARRFIDSARLKLSTFRLPVVWDDDDEVFRRDMDRLSEIAELATALGIKAALTTVAPANDLRPYHENFEFHRRRLDELGQALAAHNLQLGVEFIAPAAQRRDRAYQFLHTFDALVMLTSMLRAENVGVVVDLWQIHAAGGSLDELRKLGPQRIVALYLSDAPAEVAAEDLTDEQRLLPGDTGVIDAAAALTTLAEFGFHGPVIPMAHRNRQAGVRRDQYVKLAGERVDQAWKAAGLNATGKLVPAKA